MKKINLILDIDLKNLIFNYFRSNIRSYFLAGVGYSRTSLKRQLKFLNKELVKLEEGITIEDDVILKANLLAYTGKMIDRNGWTFFKILFIMLFLDVESNVVAKIFHPKSWQNEFIKGST